ncbi:MAG TPA: TIGR04190 family B12-binding domain/radical SAM domain protein [Actinobacteria bacterium]|nr:TIGR04190 family B12-binding domain/radical SAM domain protein [Actinomycetota bacterium]
MPKTDLILLHAPSVYDFRKLSIMYGPVSDLIPSAPIFEMYPVGFSTIAEYLNRYGYRVRIINLAVRMLKSARFDAEELIRSLRPRAFGIDLHWLPHAHGSLEVAKIIKRHHPQIPVIFGGFSATYFHRELINYPQVDFVMRGDSTEEPLRRLMDCLPVGLPVGLPVVRHGRHGRHGLVDERGYESVPNLTWKDDNGEVHENPLSHVPDDINHIVLDYSHVMKSVVRYRDLVGCLPFKDWLKNPVTAALTCKGCTRNCTFCGGSAYTMKNFYNRKKIAYRDPELVAEDIKRIQRTLKSPTFVLGDLRQAGDDYADRFLEAIKGKISNQVGLEFFLPPPEVFFKKAQDALPHYSMGASLESHDLKVRKGLGKSYTNEEIEASIGWALKHGVERFEIYYMTGLPHQTADSVLETVDYCDYLYRKFNGDKRVLMFISPMTPFVDPGSLIYENPEKYGCKIRYRTLEEHRRALLQPSWKYILNYETVWMSRSEQVESTYQAMLGINRVKTKYGVISEAEAHRVESRLLYEMDVMREIDGIMGDPDPEVRAVKLRGLKKRVDKYSVASTAGRYKELDWLTQLFTGGRLRNAGLFNFRLMGILRTVMTPSRIVGGSE